jgi:hypothetical protein
MISNIANDAKELARFAIRSAIWGSIAAVFAAAALLCLVAALFVWISTNYGSLIAFLCLAGVFLFAAVVAGAAFSLSRSRLKEKTENLSVSKPVGWIDPTIVVTVLDVARIVGGRRLSLAVALASAAYWLIKKSDGSARTPRYRRPAGNGGRSRA